MTIAPESSVTVGPADLTDLTDLTDLDLTEAPHATAGGVAGGGVAGGTGAGSTGAGGTGAGSADERDLSSQATAVVQRAIVAGSAEVALRYLEIEAQRDIARRKRRQTWILAALGGLLVLALVAAVLAFQSMQGGNTGEAAPEPLGFGDAPTVELGGAPADSTDVATGEPAMGVDVLGAAETAGTDGVGEAIAPAGAPSAPVATGGLTTPSTRSTPSAPRSSGSSGAAPGAPSTSPAPGAPAAGPAPSTPAPTTPAPTGPSAPAVGALDGNWSVIGGSQAGYRVSKRWTLTGDSEEVVGRTARVSGTMAIAQDRVTTTGITIDMASVDSANGIRDAAYRQDILNTAAYPTARFDLTAPIDIRSRPAAGTVFTTPGTGRLTIRGVTRDVTVQLQARQSGGSIQVVGTIPVTFADFGIASPNLPIVTVANQGTIEFQVNLAR